MAQVQVRVRGLMIDDRTKSPIVVLQEEGGERILPIWIGEPEARAIGIVLAGERLERPLTHDLIMDLLKAFRARVVSIAITDLKENTFFAEIHLDRNGERILIDARPSDSIALALRADADIFVAESVIEGAQGQGWSAKVPEKTEAEKTAELRKFLEDMDPGDFGRFGL
jgi:hypothetical protein